MTNLCVYWDEIFLGEQTAAPTVRPTDLPVTTADLRFGATSSWEPTPGLYTRYGEVGELLRQVDDRLVVMGAGDQLGLTFDASGLPALPSAWRRISSCSSTAGPKIGMPTPPSPKPSNPSPSTTCPATANSTPATPPTTPTAASTTPAPPTPCSPAFGPPANREPRSSPFARP